MGTGSSGNAYNTGNGLMPTGPTATTWSEVAAVLDAMSVDPNIEPAHEALNMGWRIAFGKAIAEAERRAQDLGRP